MRTLLIVDDNAELASLLAVVAEVHGFASRVAHTGREALALLEAERPTAALVDLLLPDIGGNDVLEALRAHGVMTCVMSGVYRGEQYARAAVEDWGARAYFEKPFAAREAMARLVALLESELAAGAEAPIEPTTEPTAIPELGEFDLEDVPDEPRPVPPLEALVETTETTGIFAAPSAEPSPSSEPSLEPPPLPRDVFDEPTAEIPAEVAAQAAAIADATAMAEAAVMQVLGEPDPEAAWPAEAADEPVDEPVAASPPPPPGAALEPDPGMPLPFSGREVWSAPAPSPSPAAAGEAAGGLVRLLADLARRKATGELQVKRGEVTKVVALKEGRVVFAASNLGTERLLRFAPRAGKVPAERLPALQEAVKGGARTRDALLELGLVDRAGRQELVTALVREIIWSLLEAEGQPRFAERAPARKGLLPIALDTVPLLVEGYRRSLTLVRLRALVDEAKRYVQVREPPLAPEELGLQPAEAALLAAADGSKTVEDLVLLSELGEREALAALVALTSLGVLEARAPAGRRIVLV